MTSLSSAQMRALRWRHDNQQGKTVTACSERREKSTCDSNRGISAHEIEARVLNGLRDILLGNESLVDEFAAEFKRELTRLRKQGHGATRSLLKELQQVERGIKRCLAFITGVTAISCGS